MAENKHNSSDIILYSCPEGNVKTGASIQAFPKQKQLLILSEQERMK